MKDLNIEDTSWMNSYDVFSSKIDVVGKYNEVNQSNEVSSIIISLRSSIQKHGNWKYFLLKAIGEWPLVTEEFKKGIQYNYLIFGEAFDWPLLARRLTRELIDLVNPNEVIHDLNNGEFMHAFTQNEIKDLLGTIKYRGYLNYWYGVIVEESLHQVSSKMLLKDLISKGFHDQKVDNELVLMHLYEQNNSFLLQEFFDSLKSNETVSTNRLSVWILYFLFKRRVNKGEPTRVASDTNIAIERLKI
ncbi:MAG: hypothetical protein CL785_03535 [Chloroflexi bacterium]|nr:hypothetical protein [Chloroflexota bacterium]|tara:strand:- start:6770 stop:7504 length:735 start_codon:yes stop_codon:yes gene_type:complete